MASGAFDLAYNANGELTSKTNRDTSATQTYSYSTLGALKSVTTPNGLEIPYKYDAQGNRVEARTDGEPTQRLIYAPGLLKPVAELETTDREETRYVYASRVNVPDYMVRGGRTFRFVTDQLGSVRFVVDSSTGEIAQEIAYDPFGEVIGDSAPGFQPLGFAGGLYSSETGLTHFGAREYDAGLGRWTSTDPISFGGGDSNLYGYVVQDPVNLVDPNGLLFNGILDSPVCAIPNPMCAPMAGYESIKFAVTPVAQKLQDWGAEKAFSPGASKGEQALGWLVGAPASLFTCENFDTSVITIGAGPAGGPIISAGRKIGLELSQRLGTKVYSHVPRGEVYKKLEELGGFVWGAVKQIIQRILGGG